MDEPSDTLYIHVHTLHNWPRCHATLLPTTALRCEGGMSHMSGPSSLSSKHGASQHQRGRGHRRGSRKHNTQLPRTSVAPQPAWSVAGLTTVQRRGDELNAVCLCSGRDHHINTALIQHAGCCMLITPLSGPSYLRSSVETRQMSKC